MKKNRKILSIITTVFILNFIMISSTAFAASTLENVIEQYGLKEKVSDFLLQTGRQFINNLADSVVPQKGTSVPAMETKNLQGKKITIDPGHGGYNPGAVRYGLREADNNLAVALKLKNILEARGANVIMTRTTDVSLADSASPLREELQARVDIAQKNNTDLFVSVHTNANENTAIHGAMTFYYDDASKKLAESIQTDMIRASQAADKRTAHGNFLVLRNSNIPAVLVEMGFITNEAEAMKLNDNQYRDKIAGGIADGIQAYFKNSI